MKNFFFNAFFISSITPWLLKEGNVKGWCHGWLSQQSLWRLLYAFVVCYHRQSAHSAFFYCYPWSHDLHRLQNFRPPRQFWWIDALKSVRNLKKMIWRCFMSKTNASSRYKWLRLCVWLEGMNGLDIVDW